MEVSSARAQADEAYAAVQAKDAELEVSRKEVDTFKSHMAASESARRVLAEEAKQMRLQKAEVDQTAHALTAEAQQLRHALDAALTDQRHHEQLRAELDAVYASRSWRLTRALRVGGRIARRPAHGFEIVRRLREKANPLMRRVLGKAVRVVLGQPRLYGLAVRTLRRFPTLDRKVRAMASRAMHNSTSSTAPLPASDLPRGAQRWHAALKRVTAQSH